MDSPTASKLRTACVGLACLAFPAWGAAPPGCADPKTVSLVGEVFWNSVARNAVNPEDKVLLAQVRPKFQVTLEAARMRRARKRDRARRLCRHPTRAPVAC